MRLVQLWWGQTPLPPREGPRLRQGDPNTGGEGKKKNVLPKMVVPKVTETKSLSYMLN